MSANSDLIRDEFKRVFGVFLYPFKTSDQLLRAMPLGKRQKYLREAEKINKSEVTISELNEICREFYFQLAVNVKKGEDEELIYKGALLFASIYKKRLYQLAMASPNEFDKAIVTANQIISELIPE